MKENQEEQERKDNYEDDQDYRKNERTGNV